MLEERPVKTETYEIKFGTPCRKHVCGPYVTVLVEAASHEEAVRKAARMVSERYNAWVMY